MKNILIIGAGEGLGQSLINKAEHFDNIYTVSRKEKSSGEKVTHIMGDVTQDIDFSTIEKSSLDIIVYIPSLWGSSSDMTSAEFEDYMKVGPGGLLKCFHNLKDGGYLRQDSLLVSIGSTASETALSLGHNGSSSVYSLSKLTQKSILVQLSHLYKDYRYLNVTLGSIGEEAGVGVGYENIYSTIDYACSMKNGVRYTEVQLLSNLDI